MRGQSDKYFEVHFLEPKLKPGLREKRLQRLEGLL